MRAVGGDGGREGRARDDRGEPRRRLAEHGRGTILFLDEVHRFNKSQQDALLPAVEDGRAHPDRGDDGEPVLRGQRPAAVSRSTLFRLEPLGDDDLRVILDRALAAEGGTADDDAARPDREPGRRRCPGRAHDAGGGAGPGPGRRRVTLAHVEAARQARALRYERGRPLRHHVGLHQEHPGVGRRRGPVLAGPDAGGGGGRPVHRPAAGDPGVGGRRHGRLDGPGRGRRRRPGRGVRRACPRPSSTWPTPSSTWRRLRSRTAPPSGCGGPRPTSRTAPRARCPPTCATPTTGRPRSIGHGQGYVYPHDQPGGWADQQYRPDELAERSYYEPSATRRRGRPPRPLARPVLARPDACLEDMA